MDCVGRVRVVVEGRFGREVGRCDKGELVWVFSKESLGLPGEFEVKHLGLREANGDELTLLRSTIIRILDLVDGSVWLLCNAENISSWNFRSFRSSAGVRVLTMFHLKSS